MRPLCTSLHVGSVRMLPEHRVLASCPHPSFATLVALGGRCGRLVVSLQARPRASSVLTFGVKDDLYVSDLNWTTTARMRVQPVPESRSDEGDQGLQTGSLGGQDAKPRWGRTENGAVRLSAAAYASCASRSVAIPSLTLPRRPALAGAGAPGEALVFDRTRTFDGRPAGLRPATPRRVNELGGTGERRSGRTAYPGRPDSEEERACWDGRSLNRPSA